ncbi:glutaredoxin-c9 [Quercus suber]|uniref:Glutaredoxin-c9 n=1 Tax=Quercus suber TaxID=58331 RepID=A0AAW0KD18_QUESU
MQEAIPYKSWQPLHTRTHFINNNTNLPQLVSSKALKAEESENIMLNMVAENAVIVIARRGCCMSHVVKRLLLGLGVNPAVYEVDEKDESWQPLHTRTHFINNNTNLPQLVSSKALKAEESENIMLNMVAENAVIVIARRGCCMSHVVKRLLLGLGVNPAVYEVDEKDEVGVVKELEMISNGKDGKVQFPAVFIGGRLFGGLDRVMATHISGELVPILKEAGALTHFINNNTNLPQLVSSKALKAEESENIMLNMVAENAVIVIARRGCCMSHVVKRLLLGLGVNPAVYEVDEKDEVGVVKELEMISNGKDGKVQFPAVFIGGRLFGGLDRVMATHISGELVPILKEAGALWL